MKKLIYATTLGLLAITANAQTNWQKGGNANTPVGAPPTIGTDITWNSPLNFVTRGVQRMTILGGLPGGATTGFVGIGTPNPQSFTHIHNPAGGIQSSFTQWTNPTTTSAAGRGLFAGTIFSTALISQAENANLVFGAGTGGIFNNHRMVIVGSSGTSLGYVGIGTNFYNPQSYMFVFYKVKLKHLVC